MKVLRVLVGLAIKQGRMKAQRILEVYITRKIPKN